MYISKKRGIFLFFVLTIISAYFVTAQSSGYAPPCSTTYGGVEVCGLCYDCGYDEGGSGTSDPQGICPTDYGKTCGAPGEDNCDPDCGSCVATYDLYYRAYSREHGLKYWDGVLTKTDDTATCDNANDCVYDGNCYTANNYHDPTTSGLSDGLIDMRCIDDVGGKWLNVDYYNTYCTGRGFNWNVGSGDARAEDGYYSTVHWYSHPTACVIGSTDHPSLLCCCGDDTDENYNSMLEYYEEEGSPFWALPSKIESIQTEPSDDACCNDPIDCVYNGDCYTAGDIATGVGAALDNKMVCHGDGTWLDCDTDGDRCTLCGLNWIATGDGDIGEYNIDGHDSTSCCEDDAGENYITQGVGSGACCNNQNDCVDSTNTCRDEASAETTCTDSIDNDCDGYTDYDDSDCAFTLTITPNPAYPSQQITFSTTPPLTNIVIKDNLGCGAGEEHKICSFDTSTSCTDNAPTDALNSPYGYYACLGENSVFADLVVLSANGHCSASDTPPHVEGDESTPQRYLHDYSTEWTITDCNSMDWNTCWADLPTPTSLSRVCDDYLCEGEVGSAGCQDTTEDWTAGGPFICDDGDDRGDDGIGANSGNNQGISIGGETIFVGKCGYQTINTTADGNVLYFCFKDNSEVIRWSATKEATETECFDGFDNDCDDLVDSNDPDCTFDANCAACESTTGYEWDDEAGTNSPCTGSSDFAWETGLEPYCCGDDANEHLNTELRHFMPSTYDIDFVNAENVCCDQESDCVAGASCFATNSIHRGLNQGGGDNISYCIGSPGRWLDCDAGDAADNQCDGVCSVGGVEPSNLVKAGELGVGEYPDTTTYGCCGDDANEVYVEDGPGAPKCCQSGKTYVDAAGVCQLTPPEICDDINNTDEDKDGDANCADTECLGQTGPPPDNRKCCKIEGEIESEVHVGCSLDETCLANECIDAKTGGETCCMNYCECLGAVAASCAVNINSIDQCDKLEYDSITIIDKCITPSCLIEVQETALYNCCDLATDQDVFINNDVEGTTYADFMSAVGCIE